jgi:RecA/RadA recombinase
MAKQAIKKGAGIVKKAGISAFKEKKGMVYTPSDDNTVNIVSNADKPMEWLTMPEAFQDATKLPGIPVGYVTSIIGHSNTGKTTLLNHAMVAAQRQGLIPVYFDTENAFSFEYAVKMGLDATPIYGDVQVEDIDPETGEVSYHVENRIVNWEGNFLYYNTTKLAEQYGTFDYSTGKDTGKNRGEAVLEDIAHCMEELIRAQRDGEIDQGMVFIWDSVGSIGCYKEYKSLSANNMWAAGALSVAFMKIVNDLIPSSRKISSKYTNTFIYINKVWMDNTTNPVGPAIMRPKGGNAFKYATRLEILMGGQLTAGVKRLTATAKGLNYSYGTETKIKVLKNHLNAPHNVCYEGPLVATDTGFISVDSLDDYKKTHVARLLKELQNISKGKVNVKESDIEFGEVEEDDTL